MKNKTNIPQDRVFWIVFTIAWAIVFIGTLIGIKFF